MKNRTTVTTTKKIVKLKLIPDIQGRYSDANNYSSSIGLTLQKNNLTLNSQVGASPGYKYGNISGEYNVPIKNNNLSLYGSISKESSNPFTTEIGGKYTINIGNKDKNSNKKKL
jgi:hypothetical protein